MVSKVGVRGLEFSPADTRSPGPDCLMFIPDNTVLNNNHGGIENHQGKCSETTDFLRTNLNYSLLN